MKARHIEVFYAVYTTGSVTNAAKFLFVSQPSVSKVLSHAEQQLGFKLFERTKGRLIPTQEADQLFIEVEQIYKQLNNLKFTSESIKNNQLGHISVAVTPALGFDLLPSEIINFSKKHENVTFNVQTLHNNKLREYLIKHQSEFAILFSPHKSSGLIDTSIGYGEMVAVYSNSILPNAPKEILLHELLKYPLVNIWESGPVADNVWNQIKSKQLIPKSHFNVQTYYIAVNMIRYGAGVCIVDEFTARSQQSENVGIAKLPELEKFQIKAIHMESKPLSKLSRAFIEQISHNLNL